MSENDKKEQNNNLEKSVEKELLVKVEIFNKKHPICNIIIEFFLILVLIGLVVLFV